MKVWVLLSQRDQSIALFLTHILVPTSGQSGHQGDQDTVSNKNFKLWQTRYTLLGDHACVWRCMWWLESNCSSHSPRQVVYNNFLRQVSGQVGQAGCSANPKDPPVCFTRVVITNKPPALLRVLSTEFRSSSLHGKNFANWAMPLSPGNSKCYPDSTEYFKTLELLKTPFIFTETILEFQILPPWNVNTVFFSKYPYAAWMNIHKH